ncbi:class I SAM-dependent methyltransferase [Nonomuraea insulae]|uniref:Class I SAM-dependent methyltransferase n=1 Tax=Nonomuraea insulae TaxID=1616787 RepID=A0ABW1CHP2_9ACTN
MGLIRALLSRAHGGVFTLLTLVPAPGQGRILRRYFDWWHRNPDPWGYATESYELFKYRRTLEVLPASGYRTILDVGCSEGLFTRQLAEAYPDARVTGLDISERALSRARAGAARSGIRFLAMDLLAERPEGVFDLVVCGEMLYYLGGGARLRLASKRLSSLITVGGFLVLVHPWPGARRLYRYLDGDLLLKAAGEHVEEFSGQRFAITLYQRV